MTHRFDETVVTGVLRHMNGDHVDDNLLIARAFGSSADLVSATMVGFDGDGGEWVAFQADGTALPISIPWPDGPITERPQVRREVVALYDEACRVLGVQPRPHA